MHLGTPPTLLLRAPLRPYGMFGTFCYDPDQQQQDGGTDDKTKKEGADKKDEPAKISLTQEELDQRIQSALTSERQKAEAKAKKDQDAADRRKAEEQGEFKKLADAAEQRAAAAEARALAAERASLVNDAFADVLTANEGLSLAALNEWVRPKVLASLTAETEAADVTKQAKALAEKYAKENPPKKQGRAGAPGDIPGRMPNRPSDARSPRTNQTRPASVAAARF